MHQCERTPDNTLLLIDEFASTLDADAAVALSTTLSRWLARTPTARIILATTHAHLAPHLAPTLTAHCTLDHQITISCRAPAVTPWSGANDSPRSPHSPLVTHAPTSSPLLITPATRADLAALAPFHYRAAHPATIVHILAARREAQGPPLAVLTISMPTLNARWRALAWPDLFESSDPRTRAHLLNKSVRCISRVIVDPRHRAVGLATALIRHYLAHPLTPRTEALASMARCCPIFTRAGMREWPLPRSPRDERLLAALAALNLTPLDLADLPRATRLLSRHPSLRAALATWSTASRSTRSLSDTHTLLRRAATTLLAPPLAFTHDSLREGPGNGLCL